VRRHVGYVDGEYAILKLPGGADAPFVWNPREFDDFLYEIDFRLLPPTADGYGFLDFRRQRTGEHYSFVVDPNDGTFMLERDAGTARTPLLAWTRTSALQRGEATNRLSVRAEGTEIILLLNDTEVARAVDDAYAAGTITFGVGSYSGGRVEGRFDNLLVEPLAEPR
jgi:hypothetical protein